MGAWPDAAPTLIRPLPVVPSPYHLSTGPLLYGQDIAWNGSSWGVLAWAHRGAYEQNVFRLVAPSGAPSGAAVTLLEQFGFDDARLVPTASRWGGVFARNGLLRRFTVPATSAAVTEAPLLPPSAGAQSVYGLAWAGGRFLVGVTEGVWPVTAAAARVGAAPAAWPDGVVRSTLTPAPPVPHAMIASGARVAVSVVEGTAGSVVHDRAAFADAALTGFSPVSTMLMDAPATGVTVASVSGGFLFGVRGASGLRLRRTDGAGARVWDALLPYDTRAASTAGGATHTLVARWRSATPEPHVACVRELVALDASGAPVADVADVTTAGDGPTPDVADAGPAPDGGSGC
ncbi:MAG: hypothetical protein U0324_13575 [Polyangiales bacterium]